jgi:metalloprotease
MKLFSRAGALLVLVLLSACSESMRRQISLGMMPGSDSGQSDSSATSVFSSATNVYKATTLGDEEVRALARQQIQILDSKNRIAPPKSKHAMRVSRIAKELPPLEGATLDCKVYLSPEVNAFSMPDGSVRVYSGLMDRMSDDELRFVLGHEGAHISYGHRKERLQRAYAANAAVQGVSVAVDASAGASLGGEAARLGGDAMASMAAEVVMGQFSQSDETECDEYALRMLTEKKAPSDAAITALLKLNEVSASGSGDLLTSLTASHPDPVARARHLQALIPELAGEPDLTAALGQQTSVQAAHVKRANTSEGHGQGSGISSEESQKAIAESKTSRGILGAKKSASEGSQTREKSVSHWYIQVGVFSTQAAADRAERSITSKQYKIAQYASQSSGQTLYRILVGPFSSRVAAEAKLRSVADRPQMADAFVRQWPARTVSD